MPDPLEVRDMHDWGGVGKLMTYSVDIDFTKIDYMRQKIFSIKASCSGSGPYNNDHSYRC